MKKEISPLMAFATIIILASFLGVYTWVAARAIVNDVSVAVTPNGGMLEEGVDY